MDLFWQPNWFVEWERQQEVVGTWETLEETNRCYDQTVALLLNEDCPLILATYNERQMARSRVQPRFAQLLGLNGALTEKLALNGQYVYKFVPFGKVEIVFPYLVRRLQENADFLKYT
jgi:hypothetical protein